MEIIHYFEQTAEEQKYWQNEISKGDWTAAKFLYDLLKNDRLCETCGETTLLLLVMDKTLLAFCTLAEKDEIKADDMKPWIGFVFTFPAYRGSRYSEKLIRHALALAEKNGFETVYISTNEIGFYEKYGFTFLKHMETVWGDMSRIYVYKFK